MVGFRTVLFIVALAVLVPAPAAADHGIPHCEPIIIESIHFHLEDSPPTPHVHYDIRTECV